MQKGLRLSYLIIFTEQLILQIQEIDYRLIQYVECINIHKRQNYWWSIILWGTESRLWLWFVETCWGYVIKRNDEQFCILMSICVKSGTYLIT